MDKEKTLVVWKTNSNKFFSTKEQALVECSNPVNCHVVKVNNHYWLVSDSNPIVLEPWRDYMDCFSQNVERIFCT